MKVLYADDDKLLHRVVSHKLTKEGYEVASAYNGLEVFEMAEAERPDVLILDAMMPEMDGFSVLEEWSQRSDLSGIPVIMLTARNREEDLVEALENGAVDYLTKPFSPVELAARVKKVIKQSGGKEE